MYEVQYRRYYDRTGDYHSVARDLPTIEAAAAAREVSGDLVVDSKTDTIVTDESWLWGWEKEDPNAYASQAIRWQLRQLVAKEKQP